MYHRLGQLEVRGFMEIDRKARRARALSGITGKGRAVIEGWEDISSIREGSA
jgi:hypothetical protein